MIQRFFSYISRPLVLMHIILLIQWGIFLGITLQPYSLQVPGRTYNLLRGHLIYTSLIREARDGAWKTTITHSTRTSPAVVAHSFFIFLGKIAAIFHIDPPIMYFAARMAAAVILFWSTYAFVRVVLPSSLHSTALFFILALEPGPTIATLGLNPELWRPSIFSYYPQIVALRHFGLPHHTLGEALGILCITALFLAIQKPTANRLITLGALALLGTVVLPPYFIIISVSVFLPWAIWSLTHKSIKSFVIPMGITLACIAIVSLFLKQQFSYGYPWKDFNQDEKRWVPNAEVITSYISTLVLYIPFIAVLWARCLGIWKKLGTSMQLLIVLMTSWTLIPPLLVPISGFRWFPIANFRLMDGYNYVPAGILATLGLHYGISIFKRKAIVQFLTGFMLSALLLSTAYLSYGYTTLIMTEQSYPWSNVFLANDHYKAFKFLETVTPMSGLMVSNHFGEIAPEYAPVRSFIGSTPGYVDWDERFWLVGKFYSVGLTTQEAKEFLTREHISYVYYGDAEQSINTTGAALYPELLSPVFESPYVTVFKVIN